LDYAILFVATQIFCDCLLHVANNSLTTRVSNGVSSMNKTIRTVLIVLVLGGGIASVAYFAPQFFKKKEQAVVAPAGKIAPPSVKGMIASTKDLASTVRTTGTILAYDEVELHTEAVGLAVQVNIKEGQPVTKSQLLVKLNDADLQAQLKKARLRVELAKDREFRQKKLLDIQGISQAEYDIALNELSSAQAEIDLVKAQIAKTELRAPFSGNIGLRYISVGSYVTPQTRIAGLSNIDQVRVEFSVPEQYARLISVDDSIIFTIQGDEKEYRADIFAIDPQIDPSTRSVRLRALAPNPNKQFLPGTFCQVQVKTSKLPQAIMIPSEALIPELKGQNVFTYRNGIAKQQEVLTGIRTEREVQILSGIEIGDTVIVSGILQLRPNMNIQISVGE
jgi:membrane fusion protein, multidrug efflux system